MDNMQPYDVWKRRQQSAATASSNIQSSDENPDKVADGLNFAQEYGRVTGNPVPTFQMVKQNRETLQRVMDEARNRTLLSNARKTATWYAENPTAALLAKDDVYNLCSLEQVAQKFSETPKASPQASTWTAAAPSGSDLRMPTEIKRSGAEPIAGPVQTATPSVLQPAGSETQKFVPAASSVTPSGHVAEPETQAAKSAEPFSQPISPAIRASEAQGTDAEPLASTKALNENERAKEELIEEIRNMKDAPPERVQIVTDKIQNQIWFDKVDAMDTLYGVLNGTATDEEVRSQLGSVFAHRLTAEETWERAKYLGQNSLEVIKGTPGGTVSLGGYLLEAEGQLQNSYPTANQRTFLEQIPKAINLTDDEFARFEQDIYRQNLVDPMEAHITLRALRSGNTTPEKVRKSFENPFPELSKKLEIWGEQLQDYGDALFPAAPGYENSIGRKIGKAIGLGAPIAVAGYFGGPLTVAILASLQAAGEGAADARKRGLTEEQQSLAAQRYFWTGPNAAIPVAKYLSPLLQWLPGRVLQGFLGGAIDESLKQGAQKTIRNEMDRLLYDPLRKWSDGVVETMLIAAAVGSVNHGLEKGLAFFAEVHGDSHTTAQKTGAAIQVRQTVGQMSDIAQTSLLHGRFPEALHSHNSHVLKDSELEYFYVSPEAHARYSEATRGDLFEFAENHINQVASETGADIKIPMANYLARSTGSKADADLMDNMRLRPSDYNYSEALAAQIGTNSNPLKRIRKPNGPYTVTGYRGLQVVDSFKTSRSHKASPTANEVPDVIGKNPAFSLLRDQAKRLNASTNTKRTLRQEHQKHHR